MDIFAQIYSSSEDKNDVGSAYVVMFWTQNKLQYWNIITGLSNIHEMTLNIDQGFNSAVLC